MICSVIDYSRPVLVAGGGGFIGGHLVRELLESGYRHVRSVDIKPLDEWYFVSDQAENIVADLNLITNCRAACVDVGTVYNLACNMGGMGFIENNRALCMISVLINTHLLMSAREVGVDRYFLCKLRMCVRRGQAGARGRNPAQRERRLSGHARRWIRMGESCFPSACAVTFGKILASRRGSLAFHNIYGPQGTWQGGREKAPAAICRKVIHAKATGDHRIEIWGDGKQTRSFTFIDDCLTGIDLITHSDITEPLNLGSSELVTINGLVDIVEDIAGIKLERSYNLDAPKGVNGRNSDNSRIQNLLKWAPSTRLRDGLEKTYQWIESEYHGPNGAAAGELTLTIYNNQTNSESRTWQLLVPQSRLVCPSIMGKTISSKRSIHY